jgi:hypothetical protein
LYGSGAVADAVLLVEWEFGHGLVCTLHKEYWIISKALIATLIRDDFA